MNFNQCKRPLAILSIVSALAACGGGSNNSNQSNQPNMGQINEGEDTEITSNTPPNIQQIQTFNIEAGVTLEMGLLVSDPDGDTLRYMIEGLPEFISSQMNNDTLTFIFVPDVSDEGVYSVDFSVTDGRDTTHGSLDFAVLIPNRAPYLSSVNGEDFSSDSLVVVQEGRRSEVELVFEDPDGDQVSVSNLSTSPSERLGTIEMANAGGNVANIFFEPGFASSGRYTISLNLNDGEANQIVNIPMVVEQAFSGEISAISNGNYHSCAIENREIICWGLGDSIAGYELIGLEDPIHLTSGYYFSCAANQYDVKCWGNLDEGQGNIPVMQGEILKLAAGYQHVCALTTESVYCWGDESPFILTDYHGQADVPSDLHNVIDISAGHFHTCVLEGSGSIRCWGTNSQGESNPPEINFIPTSIDLGRNRSCAANSEKIICWGQQSWYDNLPPPENFSDLQYLDIGNEGVSCAIDQNQLECWGDGGENIVDYYHFGRMSLPGDIENLSNMTIGNRHACIVSDNGVDCWGAGEEGAEGLHNYAQSIVPNYLTK